MSKVKTAGWAVGRLARRWVPVALMIVAAFSAGLLLGVQLGQTELDMGSVPDWLGGLLTAGALIFAAYVYNRDLRERHVEARSAQARLVDAWVRDAAWVPHATMGDRVHLKVVVEVGNGSAQSVRGFDVAVVFEKNDVGLWGLHVISPTSPENPRQFELVTQAHFDSTASALDTPDTLIASIQLSQGFTDAAGNRWHREPNGRLKWLYNLGDKADEQGRSLDARPG